MSAAWYCYSAVTDKIWVNSHNVFLWDANKGLNKTSAEIRPKTVTNFTRTVLWMTIFSLFSHGGEYETKKKSQSISNSLKNKGHPWCKIEHPATWVPLLKQIWICNSDLLRSHFSVIPVTLYRLFHSQNNMGQSVSHLKRPTFPILFFKGPWATLKSL